MFDENEKLIGEESGTEEKAFEEKPVEEKTVLEEPLKENVKMPEIEKPATENRVQPNVKAAGTTNINYAQYNKPKKKTGAFKKIVLTALCALVAGLVFSMSAMWALFITGAHTSFTTITTTKNADGEIETTETTLLNYPTTKRDGEMAVEDIVEACIPSVVSITNKGVSEVMTFFGNYQTESISSGSGIIIGENEAELLIVTNYHVVAGSQELTVVFSHEEDLAQSGDDAYLNVAHVKGYDENKDIAVIAVKLSEISDEAKQNIKVAAIGNSREIKLGSGVVAIGNSLGYGQSVTHGIISALDREVTLQGVNGGTITNKYIQTDAAINSGNSGGALLNMQGELIGINSAKISSTGVEGMGYAIPISDVEELIGELMNMKTREIVDEDKRGYLGIYGLDVTESDNRKFGMPVGVFVQEIIENSPAERSELKYQDIITEIDGVSVGNMSALQERLCYYEAGEAITLTVKRLDGREYIEIEVDITLGSKRTAGIEN